MARRALRLALQAIMEALVDVKVRTPGNWETQPVDLPEIKLRTTTERKTSTGRQSNGYTTVVGVELLARVSNTTAEDAQDDIEALGALIEDAVFAAPTLFPLIQQIATTDSEMAVDASGDLHIGELRMTLQCETFETFDPTVINAGNYPVLQQLQIHLDLIAPYDPSGSYSGSAFPSSINPAPRTAGPDGRDEAVLRVDLPT